MKFNSLVLISKPVSLYSYDKEWSKVETASKNCEFVWTANLSLDLATFYVCINDYLIDNCEHYQRSHGYDLVETRMIKRGKFHYTILTIRKFVANLQRSSATVSMRDAHENAARRNILKFSSRNARSTALSIKSDLC